MKNMDSEAEKYVGKAFAWKEYQAGVAALRTASLALRAAFNTLEALLQKTPELRYEPRLDVLAAQMETLERLVLKRISAHYKHRAALIALTFPVSLVLIEQINQSAKE